MKYKLYTLLASFILTVCVCQAGSYTWTGATGNNWATPANWQPNGIPGTDPADVVTIGEAVCSPRLDGNRTIGNLIFSSQILDLNTFLLKVTGNASVLTSGLIKNGSLAISNKALATAGTRLSSSNVPALVLNTSAIGNAFIYTVTGAGYTAQAFTGGTTGTSLVLWHNVGVDGVNGIVLKVTDPDNGVQKNVIIYTDASGNITDVQDDGASVLTTYAHVCGGTLTLGTGLFVTCTLAYDNQNYIRTHTVLVSGITDPAAVPLLKSAQHNLATIYFDGLDRPVQSVVMQASPLRKDVVQVHQYDIAGREPKMYLPYASTVCTGGYTDAATALANQQNFYTTNTDPLIPHVIDPALYTGTQNNAYTQQVFDNSPLNRVLQQAAPGDAWKLASGKIITHTYRTNAVGEVLLWTYDPVSGNATAASGGVPVYYPLVVDKKGILIGNLFVLEETDENGAKSIQFADALGRSVLKQQQKDDGSFASTYYIYDDFNNLVYVVPPEATKQLSTQNWTITPTGSFTQQWLFSYRYDSRHRVISSQVPGAAAVQTVYDLLDRPVATQDGNQQAINQWTFNKYDALGRTVLTGLTTDARTQSGLQAAVNTQTTFYESRVSGGTMEGYSNTVLPTAITNNSLLTVSYFDDYDFNNDNLTDYTYRPQGLSSEPVPFYNTVLLSTGTKVRNLDTQDWLLTTAFYDNRYRAIQSQGNNQLYLAANPGSTDLPDLGTNVYDFTGRVLNSVKVYTPDAAHAVTISNRFSYDPYGRVLETWQQNNTDPEIILSQSRYNELGKLIEKNLHSENNGGSFLQSVDYRYNIRGWLTSLNNSTLSSDAGKTNNDVNDLFGTNLFYEQAATGLSNTALYNGNISAVKWQTKNPYLTTAIPERGYAYTYDRLNRIKESHYYENNTAWTALNKYSENGIQYDDNGNIQQLNRYGGTAGTYIDQLQYNFAGNALIMVTDASSDLLNGFGSTPAVQVQLNAQYTYDANGNMTADNNKGISIEYNYLNRINQVGSGIHYTYDAAGNKLAKTVTGTGGYVTNYIGEAQYEGNILSAIYNGEGRIIPNGSSFIYEYQLKDHQGNVRAVFDKDASTGNARLVQEDNYYAFGLRHNQTSLYVSGSEDKYLYNNKELQNETGYYDYGARQYDAVLASWHSIDLLAERYYSISPYGYVANNPIFYIDTDGEKIVVPNVADRAAILKMINSKAAGLFAFNSNGEIYLVRKGIGGLGFSTYYRDKLIAAIAHSEEIIIKSGTKYKEKGIEKNVDDAGGGVTLKRKLEKTITTTDGDKVTIEKSIVHIAEVTISGNGSDKLLDTEGKPLRDEPADILAHELLGHAIPYIVGQDTGNAVENENKARSEYKEGDNQKRASEPTHIE